MAKSKIRKYFLDPILGLDIVQWCFAIPVSLMMWLVFATCCTHIHNKKILKEYRKKPAVFVVWHGRSMVPTAVMALYRMRSCVVTSRHKDGRFMAKIQHMFGGRAIFGSSSSGGVSVLREGVRLLNKGGRCLVLSPDGPGGPSLRMQEGAMYFAKMTGAPIIPVCFSASKSWFQKRWDRYLVVLPFSKVIVDVGEPMFVKSKIKTPEFEQERLEIEKKCIKQLRDLDKIFNLMQVEEGMKASTFKKQIREGKKLVAKAKSDKK